MTCLGSRHKKWKQASTQVIRLHLQCSSQPYYQKTQAAIAHGVLRSLPWSPRPHNTWLLPTSSPLFALQFSLPVLQLPWPSCCFSIMPSSFLLQKLYTLCSFPICTDLAPSVQSTFNSSVPPSCYFP